MITRALVMMIVLGASTTASAQGPERQGETAAEPSSDRATDEVVPEPPESSPAPATELGSPTTPEASRIDAARRLASLTIDEATLERMRGAADGERVLSTNLYVGGVAIVLASVSLFVIAALQGACVAEADLGCYDASEYMVGGLASGAIGAVILSGAGFADRRAGFLEGQARERERDLEDRREELQRRVGLAVAPGGLWLSVEM